MPHTHDHHPETTRSDEWGGLQGRFWAWFMAGWPRRLTERLFHGNPRPRFFEILDLKGSEVVVDAGCGSGFYSFEVAKRLDRGTVVCVDESPQMLKSLIRRVDRSPRKERFDIRPGDCLDLPVEDGVVDAAFSVGVWHHLEEFEKAGEEMLRVLKPGGRGLVIESAHMTGSGHGEQQHDGENPLPLNAENLSRLLRDAGFEDVRIETVKSWVIAHGKRPTATIE